MGVGRLNASPAAGQGVGLSGEGLCDRASLPYASFPGRVRPAVSRRVCLWEPKCGRGCLFEFVRGCGCVSETLYGASVGLSMWVSGWGSVYAPVCAGACVRLSASLDVCVSPSIRPVGTTGRRECPSESLRCFGVLQVHPYVSEYVSVNGFCGVLSMCVSM